MKLSTVLALAPIGVMASPPGLVPYGLPLDSRQAATVDSLMKAKGKLYFGTCADQRSLGTARNAEVIKQHFSQLTPENSMKWDQIEPQRGTFRWDQPDALMKFAGENNITVRGHTFVWHSQLAGWVSQLRDKAALTKAIQDHITEIMTRWKGKIRAWDVVNEMFNEDGSIRQSVFSQVLGEDFVRVAFEAARKADPDAILYINDYNLDSPNAAKTTRGMADHVKKWIAAGIPIDGIGSQGHLTRGQGQAHANALRVLADVPGVKEVAITELDIQGAPADDYVAAINGCMNVPKCVGVTVWGVRDPDSWRASTNPLLFDSGYNPKAAYNAIVQALQRAG